MKIDSRPLDDLGDPHAEPGTKPWSVWVANEIRKALYDNQQSGTRLQSLTQSFKQHQGYKPLGYRTWPDFCKRKLNTTPDKVDEETQLRLRTTAGRPSANDNYYNYNNLDQQGTSSKYLAARLARDNPEVLEDVKRGKYKSMRAAAVAVGIIDPEKSKRYSLPVDPEAAARYLLERVDADWLEAFRKALTANAFHGTLETVSRVQPE